jgi:hypothetical protein
MPTAAVVRLQETGPRTTMQSIRISNVISQSPTYKEPTKTIRGALALVSRRKLLHQNPRSQTLRSFHQDGGASPSQHGPTNKKAPVVESAPRRMRFYF